MMFIFRKSSMIGFYVVAHDKQNLQLNDINNISTAILVYLLYIYLTLGHHQFR
jgi:hypothetical protein